MKEANKIAIAGGYVKGKVWSIGHPSSLGLSIENRDVTWQELILDNEWWKCISKALNWWEEGETSINFNGFYVGCIFSQWEAEKFLLIDHLHNSGNIDEFFNRLISNEE